MAQLPPIPRSAMNADYFTVHKGHIHPLQAAIRRGHLTCYAMRLPAMPNGAPLKTLQAIGRAGLEGMLKSCLEDWLSTHLPVKIVETQAEADVVLGYGLLVGPGNYSGAMTTGWTAPDGGTSFILMDYQTMRWDLTESRLGFWASISGRWRIPVRSLLLHECGHALGLFGECGERIPGRNRPAYQNNSARNLTT